MRSSVYFLIVLSVAGLACAAPIEIAKLSASRFARPMVVYVALTLQQILVFADVIRSHGWDWWIFLLDMFQVMDIDRYTWMEGHATLMGPWPWPSAVSAIIVGGLVARFRATE